MSNYCHFDTGRDGKVSAVLDINFSKLRNFDGKANNGFLKGPKQSFTLDADYAMDKSNKFNLFLDYNKENLTYDVDYSSYESYGINDVYKSKQDIERRTAALIFNGNNRENEYMFGITYSRLDKEEVGMRWISLIIMTTGVAVNTNY